MRSNVLMIGLVVPLISATGCERLADGLDIVNETDRRLYLYETPIQPDGEPWLYTTTDCSTSDLTLRTKDGTVFAELTEKWCPGQTWIISGKNESTLEDR